jgi:hypothetical protein
MLTVSFRVQTELGRIDYATASSVEQSLNTSQSSWTETDASLGPEIWKEK